MQIKTMFTFTLGVARDIRRLAEYEARQAGMRVDTQRFLESLVARAKQEMLDEQRAASKIRTCPQCGKVFSGNPACPSCGQWVA